MATVIFKWNPSFSSYEMWRYLTDLENTIERGPEDYNWSVWDYDKIHKGDRYFWVKLGYGQTGIVSTGTITSEPYEDEDWSGKERQVYYVDFEPDIMINPDTLPILTNETLVHEIPDFEWTKGHSGLVLTDEQASKLEQLWNNFLTTNKKLLYKGLQSDNEDQIYDRTDILSL